MLLVAIPFAENTSFLTIFSQRKTKLLRFFGIMFNSHGYSVEIYLISVSQFKARSATVFSNLNLQTLETLLGSNLALRIYLCIYIHIYIYLSIYRFFT